MSEATGVDVDPGELARVISEASEEAWCASWLVNAEAELWARLEQQRVHGAASSWGLLGGSDLRTVLCELERLCDATGSWAVWAQGGPRVISLQEWLTEYWPHASPGLRELAQTPPSCGRFVETDSQGAVERFMAQCIKTAGHRDGCEA